MDKEFTKMSKEEFVEAVKTNIKSYLPEEYQDAELIIDNVSRESGAYTGMIVKLPGQDVAPTINMDDLYRALGSFDEKMEQIADFVTAAIPEELIRIKEMMSDYENIKDKLFIKVNCSDNEENFSNLACRYFEDMIVTYHVRFKDFGSVAITKDIMESFGVSEKKLFADAIKSSEKLAPPEISSMGSILHLNEDTNMTIVSNSMRMHGASAMLYPNVLNRIAKDGKILILPSSIHEIITLPDNGNIDVEHLHNIVKEINHTAELEGIKLSDHIYSYENGRFTTVA